VKEAGCVGLFSGVESLQSDMIERYSKKQNRHADRFDIARTCIDHGMVFDYGLIFDPAHQTIDSFRADINDILSRDDVTSPGFLSLAIPLPGTPLFREIAAEGGFLPNVRLRDMDGDTLVVWPKDPLDEVAAYVRTMSCMREHRAQLFRQVFRFAWNRRNDLTWDQLAVCVVKPLFRAFYDTSPFDLLHRRHPNRSAVTTTEPLDSLFTPAFPVNGRHAHLFTPTMVTNRKGEVILEDLMAAPKAKRALPLSANVNSSPVAAPLEMMASD